MTDGGRYLHGRPAAADGERHHESTKNLRRCSEERARRQMPPALGAVGGSGAGGPYASCRQCDQ